MTPEQISRSRAVEARLRWPACAKIELEVADTISALIAENERLTHNNEVLTNALWKASGDDEQCVNEYIASQGELK